MSKVIVVGGGAAGMMAAISAAECGHSVILIEHNEKLGKKIYITGKGRCNLTNDCDVEELFRNIVTNPKFLYSAIYSFDNAMVEQFMEENGCKIKVERGKRVFPVSDHSYDVINACARRLQELKVDIHLNTQVTGLILSEGICRGVVAEDREIYADAVILATGGLSYSSTGSTGDGHRFARQAGINVKKCCPALVPFVAKEEWIKDLQGLSLRNVGVRILNGDRLVYEDFGELLFTHFGVSGPTVLSASSYCVELITKNPLLLEIDLKPALSLDDLDSRLVRDFETRQNKNFSHALDELLPKSLIPVAIALSGIEPERKVNAILKEERQKFAYLLKHLTITLTALRGFEEAIITHGGIDVKEINPSTMESKKISGLYFAGEVMDVDAVTGGFNLQIAWSTGHLAGCSIP